MFTQIIEQVLPIDYYCEASGIMIDCTILKRLLHTNATKLNEHLISKGYELLLNNILYKWLLSLFIHTTSEEVMLCIWDVLLLEGHIVLFKAAIALLKIIEKDVLSSESIDTIMHTFDTKCESITCCKALRYYLLIKRYDFDTALIKNNRELIFPKVSNTIKKIPLKRKQGSSNNDKQCNKLWPYCLKGKNEQFDIKDYFVYKTNRKVKIIQKYFFNVAKGKSDMCKGSNINCTNVTRKSKSFEKKCTHHNCDTKEAFDMLLIQRKKHHCTNTIEIEKDSNNAKRTVQMSKSCKPYKEHMCDKALNETTHTLSSPKPSSIGNSEAQKEHGDDEMLYYQYLAFPIAQPPERAAFFAAYKLRPFEEVRKTFFRMPSVPVRMAS